MDDDQTQLPGLTTEQRAQRKHDYVGIFPGRVFPTGDLDVLERDGNLLFIKSYPDGVQIADAQHRIWQLLSAHSNIVDAPGNTTVLCVWGLGDVPRTYVKFDYRGEDQPKIVDVDVWREVLRSWWSDARR